MVSKLHTALFTKFLYTKVKLIACVKVDIPCKKSNTKKYFQDKSPDHVYDVIYRPHLSSSILNVQIYQFFKFGV